MRRWRPSTVTFRPLSPILQMPMLWLRSPPPGMAGGGQLSRFLRSDVAAFAALSTMAAAWRSRLVRPGNLKMIIRARRSAAGADRKLTANITTVVSG
jgi:hypothetical protein